MPRSMSGNLVETCGYRSPLAPAEAGARTQTASAIRVERPRVGSTGATAPIRQLALFGLDHRFNEAEIPAGHFQPTRRASGTGEAAPISNSVQKSLFALSRWISHPNICEPPPLPPRRPSAYPSSSTASARRLISFCLGHRGDRQTRIRRCLL